MKTLNYTLLIFFICCKVLFAINNKEIKIRGTIYNTSRPHLFINGDYVRLDSEGSFNYSKEISKPTYFAIDFGQTINLYLYQNSTLEFKLKADDDIRKIQMKGGPEQINRYLIDQDYHSQITNKTFMENFSEIVIKNESDYTIFISNLWAPFEERFYSFVQNYTIEDKYFINSQKVGLEYSKASILLRYPNWYRQYTRDFNFNPSDSYYDFLKALDFNLSEFYDNNDYKSFINHYLDYQTTQILNKNPVLRKQTYPSFHAKKEAILGAITDPYMRSELIFAHTKFILAEYYHKDIDEFIQVFNQYCLNEEYKKQIQKMLDDDKEIRDQCEIQVYKEVDGFNLDAFIMRPKEIKKSDKRPALAFFHGGGWRVGKPEWGYWMSKHVAEHGMVGISFEYRLDHQHDATPIEGIKDAKSAIRWIKEHADELNIDTDRIVASGFSAGGHLSLSTTLVNDYDEATDNLSLDPKVNAFILWSSAYQVYEGGYFNEILRGKANAKTCDPTLFVKENLPPVLIIHGEEDRTVPVKDAKAFAKRMKDAGNRCELNVYEGQRHLGWEKNNEDAYKKIDGFLESLGYYGL